MYLHFSVNPTPFLPQRLLYEEIQLALILLISSMSHVKRLDSRLGLSFDSPGWNEKENEDGEEHLQVRERVEAKQTEHG